MNALPALLATLAMLALALAIWIQLRPVTEHWSDLKQQVAFGLIFAVSGIFGQFLAIRIEPGVYISLNSSVVAVTALFGGPVSGLITAAISAVQRVAVGGDGVELALWSIIAVLAIGVAIHRHSRGSVCFTQLLIYATLVNAVSTLLLSGALGSTFANHIEVVGIRFVVGFICVVFAGLSVQNYKKADELRKSNEFLRAAIHALPDGFLLQGPDGVPIIANASVNGDQAEGHATFAIAENKASGLVGIHAKKVETTERNVSTGSGTDRWLSVMTVPLIDQSGTVVGRVLHERDITTTRHLQAEVLKSQILLKDALENFLDGFVMIGQDRRIILCNERYRQLFPLTADLRVPGQSINTVISASIARKEISLPLGYSADDWMNSVCSLTSDVGERLVTLTDGRKLLFRTKRTEANATLIVVADVTEKYQLDQKLKALEERWNFALECADQGVWDANFETGQTYYSPLWKKLLGYGADELTDDGGLWLELIHPEDREYARGADLDHREGKTPYFEAEFRMRHKDGHWVWIADRGRIVEWDEHGRAKRMIGTHADVSARKQSEIRIRADEERFRSIFALSPVGMALVDFESQRFLLQSQSLCSMLGIPPDAFAGLTYSDIFDIGTSSPMKFEEMLSEDWAFGPLEAALQHNDGHLVPVLVTGSAIIEQDGSMQLLTVFQDITQRRSHEDQLWRLANLDTLTGLPNRMAFNARLNEALERADQTGNKVALALFDIDHFKSVNDTLGHDVGDVLLRTVAERVQKVLGNAGMFARLGGDEFAVVLEDIGEDADLTLPAEATLSAIRMPVELAGSLRRFTSSIGVSLYPADGHSGTELMKSADLALYRAKQNGRNRFEIFGPELRASASDAVQIRSTVEEAVEDGSIQVLFEPVFSRDLDDCDSADVVLSIIHPRYGALSTEHLHCAYSHPATAKHLTTVMLRHSFECVRWLYLEGVRFARLLIKLHASELKSDDFVDQFADNLVKFGLSGKAFSFAVLEDATLSRGGDFVLKQMYRLTELGCELVLDQFGSGYASLTHLRTLPIEGVQLADNFIADLESDGIDQAIVIGMVDLLHRLGLRASAPGVTSQRQLDFLSGICCDRMSGPHLAKTMTSVELGAYLRQFHHRTDQALDDAVYL